MGHGVDQFGATPSAVPVVAGVTIGSTVVGPILPPGAPIPLTPPGVGCTGYTVTIVGGDTGDYFFVKSVGAPAFTGFPLQGGVTGVFTVGGSVTLGRGGSIPPALVVQAAATNAAAPAIPPKAYVNQDLP